MDHPCPLLTLAIMLRRELLLILLTVVGCLLLLTACQGALIYPSPRYPRDTLDRLPTGVQRLDFTTDQGAQHAWLWTAGEPTTVTQWWVVFGGNGMTALDWLGVLTPDEGRGFLLIDYPGYGNNAGSCTPSRILRASEGAVAALAQRLTTTPEVLGPRLNLLGHSLGAAAALQYAAVHPCQRIILSAPFTSMVAMGHRQLFWPCGQLVWHRFDNLDRLDEIGQQTPPPRILILHGTEDRLIPIGMSESLTAAHPTFITLVRQPGATHASIIAFLSTALRQP